METFGELGLDSALVEALAGEGIEEPTALQRSAIPVLRRGASAVLQAAPGSGLLVAYGIALLDRFPGEGGQAAAIVVVPSRSRAELLALSLARLTVCTNHRVGALGVPWANVGSADVVFATLQDLETAVRSSDIKLDRVASLVLEGAESVLHGAGAERLAAIVTAISTEDPQIVVVSDPVTAPVRQWVEHHLRRAVYLPPEAARGQSPEAPVVRGTIRFHLTEDEEADATVPRLVSGLLSQGHPHVLVYSRSADQAADLGDLLALRGFAVGRPGESADVWLGVEPLEVREELADAKIDAASVAVVSADPPSDADSLDRRHAGGGPPGIVIVPPRGLPHLRRIAREAGYTLEPDAAPSSDAADQAADFRSLVEAALGEEDLVPYLLLLEPLIGQYGAAEVAAALAALVRRKSTSRESARDESHGPIPSGAKGAQRPPAWARLFLSVGRRDGIGTRDLLGAIIGESGITADQVGRIDLRDSFARVEVHDGVADRVIKALNGTSIRGRSVRADFDRGEARDQSQGSPKRRGASSPKDRKRAGGPHRGPGSAGSGK